MVASSMSSAIPESASHRHREYRRSSNSPGSVGRGSVEGQHYRTTGSFGDRFIKAVGTACGAPVRFTKISRVLAELAGAD